MSTTIAVAPLAALFIDAFGTVITQAGYASMKFGQMSKEKSKGDSSDVTSSGFCTCWWVAGLLFVSVGCFVHAGKFIDFVMTLKLFYSDSTVR